MRRGLFALVLWLVCAVPGLAQTVASPTRVDLLVIPAVGDPATVAAVATASVPVGLTAPACNQAPVTTAPPTSLVNPVNPFEFDDPFRAGRKCRISVPSGLPDGSYRVVAVSVADTCNPTGKAPVTPCPSPRSSVGVPPFSIVSPLLAPAAPTGLRSTD
jgi:hypothetical protein